MKHDSSKSNKVIPIYKIEENEYQDIDGGQSYHDDESIVKYYKFVPLAVIGMLFYPFIRLVLWIKDSIK